MIGLEPTHIEIVGEPNSQYPKIMNRRRLWKLCSSLHSSAHIDEHIEDLLRVLEPRAAAIKIAAETFKAGINAAIYYHEDFTPGIHLTAHTTSSMANMGLSIDFDLYF